LALVAPYVAEPEIVGRIGVRTFRRSVAIPRENERSYDVPPTPDAAMVVVMPEASPRLAHDADKSTNPRARVVEGDVSGVESPTPRSAAALPPMR